MVALDIKREIAQKKTQGQDLDQAHTQEEEMVTAAEGEEAATQADQRVVIEKDQVLFKLAYTND